MTRHGPLPFHGEALLAALDESLQPLLDRLAKVAEGRDDLRAEVAGTLAGNWFARPESHLGHELVAAGLLILPREAFPRAGPGSR